MVQLESMRQFFQFFPQMVQTFESWGLGVCGETVFVCFCVSLFLDRFTSQ